MTEYARIDNGQIMERRELGDGPPAHKAHLWKPVVYEGDGPLSDVTIEADCVRVVRHDVPLDQAKALYKARVDADAEAQRARYITPGALQALTYQEKHAQARAVLQLGETTANGLSETDRAAQFPVLAASVGIEADTLYAVAQIVVTRYERFADIAGAIERVRLQGKKSISDASDAAGVRAAYEGITWAIP